MRIVLARSRALWLLLVLVSGCGGRAVDSSREPSPGGGDGGTALGPCESRRSPPRFAIEPLCSPFVPSIGGTRPFVLMGRERLDGRMVEHRLRAQDDGFDCGFDVTMWLDGMELGQVGDGYQGAGWWVSGSVPLNVLTLVLRAGERLAFAAATSGNTDLLVGLTPYDLSIEEAPCEGGSAVAVPTWEGVPLRCLPDATDPTLELCEPGSGGEGPLRVVRHFQPSAEPAVVLGDAALLVPGG